MHERPTEGVSSSPLFRVWLCGPFQVERWNGSVYEPLSLKAWGGSNDPRRLLKRLLCSPRRQVRRGELLENLWPEIDPDISRGYLNDAVYRLRGTLSPAKGAKSLLITADDHSSLAVPGQEMLWVDADAALDVLTRAEAVEREGSDPVLLVQEAAQLLERGQFLEEEEGLWAHGRRATVERTRHGCVLWQARLYQQRGSLRQAETLLNALLEQDAMDEDALCALMLNLQQQGRISEGLRLYEETKALLERERLAPTEATQTTAQCLRKELPLRDLLLIHELPGGTRRTPDERTHDIADDLRTEQIRREPSKATSPVSFHNVHLTDSDSERDAVDRRDFFRETGYIAIGTEVVEVLDRFQRALKKPSTLDERLLQYFQTHTEGYWRDRHGAALASCDLLDYVIGHFQKITQLLDSPMLPSQRVHLCVIASKVAQLAGHLLFDIGNYGEARQFHQSAITAAQEADHQALQATAWARISFTWTYSNNALEALKCIQKARRLAAESSNGTVQAYLAAVEAEIQAILGDSTACLKALHEAEHIEDQRHSLEDSYWLRFDRSRLAGYKGICFRRLYRPGNPQTLSFLTEGQNALKGALAQLSPTRIQRQPVLLIDLADTYTLQGNIEVACEYATRAIPLIDQIKSQAAFRRLLQLRQALKPWQETQQVKNLDSQIAQHNFLRRFENEEMSR